MDILVNPRRLVLLLLVGACLSCLLGCLPKRSQVGQTSPSLPGFRVPVKPLFRGLSTGMKPQEVAKKVCLRWSLGRCDGIRPVSIQSNLRLKGMKSYIADLKIYRYQETSELNCNYFFYFRAWGLMAVRVKCRAPVFGPLQSLVRRYKRWYGKPKDAELLGSEHVYEWTRNRHDWRVKLLLQRNSSDAIHLDLRRRWYDIASDLEPAIEHSDRKSLQTWSKVPQSVRREVLTVAGTMIDRLKNLHLRKRYFRLYSSPWSGEASTEKDCKPVNKPKDWKTKLWNAIGFVPPTSHRLRYRLVQVYHYSGIPTSRAQRNFRIDAEGCGFHFHVSLKKMQEDWIYDPVIARTKDK